MTGPAAPRLPFAPPPRRAGRPWLAAAVSLGLHGAALGAVLFLLPDALSPPERERGVEILWQEVAEEALATAEVAAQPGAPPAVEAPPGPEALPAPPPMAPALPPPLAPPRPVRQAEAPPPAPPAPAPPPAAAPAPAPPDLSGSPPLPEGAAGLPAVPPSAELRPTELPTAAEAPPAVAPAPAPRLADASPAGPPPVPVPAPPLARQPPATPTPPAEEEAGESLPLPPPPMPPPARMAEARPAEPRPAPMRPMPGLAPLGPRGEGEREVAVAGASRATGAVSPPGLLDGHRNPQPEYPQASRMRGEQGMVGLVLRVAPSGQVTEVEIGRSSGFPQLDEAARRAALRWRFRPALRDGAPVEGTIRTAVHFRLVQ